MIFIRKITTLHLFLVFLIFISGCRLEVNDKEAEDTSYKGNPLQIAMVGEVPEVWEEQIHFTQLALEDLLSIDERQYDAVLIAEKYLSEVDTDEYVQLYQDKNELPFFFIQSKAGTMPFTDFSGRGSYDIEAKKINDDSHFISGMQFISEKQGYRGWKFSYPIEENKYQKNEVGEIYSSLFTVVEEIKNGDERREV